jgi:DASH complex subunit ASK1
MVQRSAKIVPHQFESITDINVAGQFWKEFFEASANVSLSSYEEQTVEDTTVHDEETEHTLSPDHQNYAASPSNIDESIVSPGEPTTRRFSDDVDILSSPSLGGRHSTPRMPSTATKTSRSKQPVAEMEEPSFAEYPSPYEALKREVEGKPNKSKHTSHPPTTPGKASALPDMSMTPKSSPFEIDFDIPPSTKGKNSKDTILHQGILNKTYRVAATPHTARKNKALGIGATPQTANRTRRILEFEDTMSSPLEEAPAPRLRAEFFSPVKGPRTPGISVQTPGRSKKFGRPSFEPVTAKDEMTRGRSGGAGLTGRSTRAWSDDEDDDELLDSPPKTIMFNLPESRVLQTPGMFYISCMKILECRLTSI